jgi:hypothetical protein
VGDHDFDDRERERGGEGVERKDTWIVTVEVEAQHEFIIGIFARATWVLLSWYGSDGDHALVFVVHDGLGG